MKKLSVEFNCQKSEDIEFYGKIMVGKRMLAEDTDELSHSTKKICHERDHVSIDYIGNEKEKVAVLR